VGAYFFSGKVLSLQVFFRLIFDSVKNFGGRFKPGTPPPGYSFASQFFWCCLFIWFGLPYASFGDNNNESMVVENKKKVHVHLVSNLTKL
jgi:hypothetical protein